MMMIRATKLRVLLLLVCLVPVAVPAQEALSIDCRMPEVQSIDPDNAYHEVYVKARETAEELCRSLMDIYEGGSPLAGSGPDEKVRRQLGEFGAFAANALKEDFPASGPIRLHANVDEMQEQLAGTDLETGLFPEFSIKYGTHDNLGYFSSARSTEKFAFPVDHEICRNVDAEKNCEAVFEDFRAAFNVYRHFYDEFANARNRELLRNLNRDWDRFLERSKSQTPLEVWLTTLWHRDHFKKDRIVGPPASQVIALHPQLVYEYVDEAPDGSKAEFGMAVEWIGLNFWAWKIPFGASVASVYADRQGAPDIRTGVMLHIDNRYALGWGKRGDAEGFYFTLDLLKLVEDKKEQFERYVPRN
jgi:hypothetical protein